MSSSGELKDLKVGVRVEGWHPSSRRWVKVTVTRVSTKSFQGTEVTADRDFEKWTGLTKWREPNSHNLTSALGSVQASPSRGCNSALTSLDSAKQTFTAATSSASDTPGGQSLEIFSATTGEGTNSAASLTLTSSQPRHLVSRSQSKESAKEPTMSEIVSLPSSKRSPQFSPDSLQSKTSPDYLAALLNSDGQAALTLKFSLEPLSKSAIGGRSLLSAQDTLPPPSLESDYFWLESPGALSSNGKGRPPGQTRLESFLKSKGLLNDGEVLNPVILSDWYSLPQNWLDPSECQAATDLLEARERQLEIFSIQESPPSPSAEFCTCPSCPSCQQPLLDLADGCGTCGWFTTIPWNEREWGDEPLDPDDVWRVGDRIQWKGGLQQFGTVRGVQWQELLGGKLPLILVRWDGAASDVLIPPEQLWRIWEDQEQPKVNSPELTPQPKVNSPELTPQPKINSPELPRKRCDKGQANPSGRIELQIKHKKLSSGELKSYEYNLYRYQLGGVGKVYSKVIPLGKLEEVREAIAAGHPAEVIVKWFWGNSK